MRFPRASSKYDTQHKTWSFPLKISLVNVNKSKVSIKSVNVTKSVLSCRFGHEEFFHGKFNFLCSEDLEKDVRTLSLSVSICMKAKSG